MKFSVKYASYMSVLLDALQHTEGDVLELGVGINSTFVLHWLCLYWDRKLVSYEHNPKYYRMVEHCQSDWHDVRLVADWDEADIERPWGVALVDHAPPLRRKEDIKRLADWARAIVIHDAQGSQRRNYHYEEIWPLFEYIKGYNRGRPHTVLVSNFRDVTRW